MRHKMEKHTSYFVVLEALTDAEECPFCDLEAASLHRYFDDLLYERVNDVGLRAELAQSHGFCHRHAHTLLDFGSGLGTSILYKEQVERFSDLLVSLAERTKRRARPIAIEDLNRHSGCPACVLQADDRQRYLEVLAENLSDEDMRKAFESSPPMCSPHVEAFLKATRMPELHRCFLGIQQTKYADLVRELAEFQRKNRHEFQGEAMGKEGNSWARAVRVMIGREGLF